MIIISSVISNGLHNSWRSQRSHGNMRILVSEPSTHCTWVWASDDDESSFAHFESISPEWVHLCGEIGKVSKALIWRQIGKVLDAPVSTRLAFPVESVLKGKDHSFKLFSKSHQERGSSWFIQGAFSANVKEVRSVLFIPESINSVVSLFPNSFACWVKMVELLIEEFFSKKALGFRFKV